MAVTSIARRLGAHVASTSRQADRPDLLRACGAQEAFVDSGSIAADLRRLFPGRVFRLAEIAEAHRCMEDNAAQGKIVILT